MPNHFASILFRPCAKFIILSSHAHNRPACLSCPDDEETNSLMCRSTRRHCHHRSAVTICWLHTLPIIEPALYRVGASAPLQNLNHGRYKSLLTRRWIYTRRFCSILALVRHSAFTAMCCLCVHKIHARNCLRGFLLDGIAISDAIQHPARGLSGLPEIAA
jgi:hypothetical protein